MVNGRNKNRERESSLISDNNNSSEILELLPQSGKSKSFSNAAAAAATYSTIPVQRVNKTQPDDDSKQTILLSTEIIAVPFCYLTVGLCQGLSRPLLNVYPLDLGATEAQQATVALVVMMPATLKIVYGFVSDNFPIFGLRRKPYMLIGWMSVVIVMIVLFTSADLSMEYDALSNYNDAVPPPNAPSVLWLSVAFLCFATGLWLADVMGDSIVAEKARLESSECKGQLQSTCYACRFFGIMVAAPVSTFLYSAYGPGSVVILLACVPLPMVPLIYWLQEDANIPIQNTKLQCFEIWKTISSRSVWQPMGFLYLYNLLQVQNIAWRQFLNTVLGFTAAELNSLLVVSYVFLFVGTLTYKFYFLDSSWRKVYQACILLNGVLTALQLLLIKGKTFGLPSYWFALGDDCLGEFITGVQFLPSAIMMVSLCPEGSEGASYAIFTTFWNTAILVAPSMSSLLLPIWDVSEEALRSGHLRGLFNLSVLTTIVQISPVLFLCWLPQSRDELLELESRPTSKATRALGGGLFLFVLVASMLYVVIVGVLNIAYPGWAGES